MKISEMQLNDLIQIHDRIVHLEKQLDMENLVEITDSLFSNRGQLVYMTKAKLYYLMVSHILSEHGMELPDELYALDDVRGNGEGDWIESVCLDWQEVSFWMERVFNQWMCQLGWKVVTNFGAVEQIAEDFCDMEYDRVDTEEIVKKYYESGFDVDREEQSAVAKKVLEINIYGYGSTGSANAYRSKRVGKIRKFIMDGAGQEMRIANGLRQFFVQILSELSVPFYRYFPGIDDPYVSSDDGAYVIRTVEANFYDTGEVICFTLLKPSVFLNAALVSRLCDLIEESCPQICEEQEGVKRCA